jgi:hypothetical protein
MQGCARRDLHIPISAGINISTQHLDAADVQDSGQLFPNRLLHLIFVAGRFRANAKVCVAIVDSIKKVSASACLET